MKDKVWFSEKEAVIYTSLSRATLLQLRNEGKVTYRTFGRKIVYKNTDLDSCIERNTDLFLSAEDCFKNYKHKKVATDA